MLKNWTCMTCQTTVRAPSRPRKDDVRAFCLTCSESTGRFVRRVCQALERERTERLVSAAAKSAAAKTRAAARAAKAKATAAAKYIVADVDIMAEAAKYWTVLCASSHLASPWRSAETRACPPIVVKTLKSGYSGTCFNHQVVVRYSASTDPAEVRELLLHELTHAVCPLGENHGPLFRKVLRDAAEKLWGTEVPILPLHRYGLDDLIIEQLRMKLALPSKPRVWIKERTERTVPERADDDLEINVAIG